MCLRRDLYPARPRPSSSITRRISPREGEPERQRARDSLPLQGQRLQTQLYSVGWHVCSATSCWRHQREGKYGERRGGEVRRAFHASSAINLSFFVCSSVRTKMSPNDQNQTKTFKWITNYNKWIGRKRFSWICISRYFFSVYARLIFHIFYFLFDWFEMGQSRSLIVKLITDINIHHSIWPMPLVRIIIFTYPLISRHNYHFIAIITTIAWSWLF